MVRFSLRSHSESAASSATGEDVGFWHRPLYLGIAEMGVLRLRFGRVEREWVGFAVQRTPADLVADFTGRDNPVVRGFFGLLMVIGTLFLLVELASLILGLRITTGFTSAVKALERGTEQLAAGDLDTRIELPNQDEFGDLAEAFNEMAVAVKKGREEAIERERLEKELETAREIQERLLPHAMPRIEGFDIAATSTPSRQVGGDYFDFLQMSDGRLGVAIGDVSGKGIPAALLMANLQAALQGQAIHPSSVAETVSRVNDLLTRSSESNMYATFFYGVLDGRDGSFIFCNAGHNPTLLMNSSGGSDWLSTGGIVIGMLSGQPYEEGRVTIAPGDVLVLYTDGVTEATGPSEDGAPPVDEDALDDEEWDEDEPLPVPNMFEEERLVDVVRDNAERSAREIRDAVMAAVVEHTAGMPQSDDITLVVIKRTGG
jgi:sigma-B regulation protein RsbU (phosphoserine phosphatase)